MKKLLLTTILISLVLVGCTENQIPPKAKELTVVFTDITNSPCEKGCERIDQTISPFGIRRSGCYPVDFDYEAANERLAKYLSERSKQNEKNNRHDWYPGDIY